MLKKTHVFSFSTVILSLFLSAFSFAGTKLTVEARTDTNQIRIGEQFHLDFTVVGPKDGRILFPQLPDTFNHFEVVSRGKQDTISTANANQQSLRQRFTITSFDTGFFVIPPFNFLFEGKGTSDSSISEAMLIGVTTVPVDTTKEIKDIKSTMDVPFPWAFYIPFLIGALILAAIGYIIYRKWKNKPVRPVEIPGPTARPAHEIALEKLKKAEEEKLWQQGMFKEYHSAVSDTLREYIENRFSIPALEYTTDEIMRSFRGNIISEDVKMKLHLILQLADMVKFAKVHPLPHENEQAMKDAHFFIEQTKSVSSEDLSAQEEVKP